MKNFLLTVLALVFAGGIGAAGYAYRVDVVDTLCGIVAEANLPLGSSCDGDVFGKTAAGIESHVATSGVMFIGDDVAQTVLASNSARSYVRITKDSPGGYFVRLGGLPARQDQDIFVNASSTFEINSEDLYTGVVSVIGDGASTSIFILELNDRQ